MVKADRTGWMGQVYCQVTMFSFTRHCNTVWEIVTHILLWRKACLPFTVVLFHFILSCKWKKGQRKGDRPGLITVMASFSMFRERGRQGGWLILIMLIYLSNLTDCSLTALSFEEKKAMVFGTKEFLRIISCKIKVKLGYKTHLEGLL